MKFALLAVLALIVLSPRTSTVDVLAAAQAAPGTLSAAQVLSGRAQFVPYDRFESTNSRNTCGCG